MTIAELHKIPLQSVPKDVFSLPGEAFVDAWASAFNLSPAELSDEERQNLVKAIRNGTNRLKVVDALRAASSEGEKQSVDYEAQVLRRTPDQFAIIENFTRFAPDNDVAFLRYTFDKICGRDPTDKERLTMEFDLRRNVTTREDIVKRVVSIARRDGQISLWDTMEQPATQDPGNKPPDPSSARTLPAGLSYDMDGNQTLIFVREVAGEGWMIGPDLLHQPVNVVDGGWSVSPGWLITGPKRSLEAGTWMVRLDLVQDPAARIAVQVSANSGLDTLQELIIAGSFIGNLCVDIRNEHRFVELRLKILETPDTKPWIKLRDVSMIRSKQSVVNT
ncbi:hypothetical protein [Phyllobacterium sp. YR531]|uniref:hypothetical protein n=1 Tax=Phyllobacterium sp. YR531 TaxID=1144343 RepID=UPI00026F8F82|nr:hypothetical protein [Phyllobacterium sp. YR531]EJN06075.1 hypothetical protein PMI41_00470 [Phyllobacterium sp. YR531]